MRGYWGIGIYNWQKNINIGTLWRSAFIFGASFIFTIGREYKIQSSDTVKAYRHIPLYNYVDFNAFLNNQPKDCRLVAIEMTEKSALLPDFIHPQRAIYILGAENGGLSEKIIEKCPYAVQVPTIKEYCLNVSTAGSIVMYDRYNKMGGT